MMQPCPLPPSILSRSVYWRHAEIVLVVHWIGGVYSEMRLPKRRRGLRSNVGQSGIVARRRNSEPQLTTVGRPQIHSLIVRTMLEFRQLSPS
jgi:hypothetical protein